MIKGTADTKELERFGDTMKRYLAVSKKEEDEVLNRKGNDLRIQIGKGFQRQRWKGGKRIAEREGKRRAKSGKGTLVRAQYLMDRYIGKAPEYIKKKATSRKRKGQYKAGTYSALVKTTKWQKLVWQEWQRRSAGIGVLAVSFFSKRFRYKKGERYLDVNRSKSFGTLVNIEKGDGFFRIRGYTPGLQEVGSRYGVVNQALRNVRNDTETYILRKYTSSLRSYINRSTGQR
jgi:hypothetical protein